MVTTRKRRIRGEIAERLMLLSSRDNLVYGKWKIRQLGTIRHLSSNRELGKLNSFKWFG